MTTVTTIWPVESALRPGNTLVLDLRIVVAQSLIVARALGPGSMDGLPAPSCSRHPVSRMAHHIAVSLSGNRRTARRRRISYLIVARLSDDPHIKDATVKRYFCENPR